jgi:hypothetical protein
MHNETSEQDIKKNERTKPIWKAHVKFSSWPGKNIKIPRTAANERRDVSPEPSVRTYRLSNNQ